METLMYVAIAIVLYGFGFMSGSIMMAKTNEEKLQDLALKYEDQVGKSKVKKARAKRKPKLS
tara:strand:- start:370 stop:555 length:186 start_codon:yes stop_codon:yes gene_type:complete